MAASLNRQYPVRIPYMSPGTRPDDPIYDRDPDYYDLDHKFVSDADLLDEEEEPTEKELIELIFRK